MPTRQLDYFTPLVAEDDHFPLTEAAIAVAQHAFPDLDVQHTLDEIDALGSKLKKRITADTSQVQRLQLLKHFFYTREFLSAPCDRKSSRHSDLPRYFDDRARPANWLEDSWGLVSESLHDARLLTSR